MGLAKMMLASVLTELLLRDVLKHMEEIYKTIDLRTACFKEDAEWENALTVIRFSHLETTALEEIFDSLRQKWGGEVDTPRLKVVCEALPISEYGNLTKGLLEDRILSLKGLKVKFEGKRDVDTWNCYLADYPHYLRKTEKWKTFDGAMSRSTSIPQKLERVGSDARSLGFADTYNCVSEWLQCPFSPQVSSDTILSAPVYAIIDDVDVGDLMVKVRISCHRNMVRSLRLNLLQWKGEGYWVKSIRKTDELSSKSTKDLLDQKLFEVDSSFRTCEVDYEIPFLSPSDFLDVRLIYDRVESLEIDRKEGALAGFKERKAAAVNPFFSMYDRFCNYDELINQLKNPQNFATTKKREPSQIFERAVSWLLALCGLQTIKLDEYEKFKPRAGKSEYDSVDIVAYSREKSLIILASCTIGAPDLSKDVLRLLEVTRRLEEDLFKETSTILVPVIFSSYRRLEPIKEGAMKYNVKVIDSTDAERMVTLLRDGKTQDALAFVVS